MAGSHEARVRDEAGNVTTFSPHNFSIIPGGPSESLAWSFYSERENKAISVDMTKAIRLVEELTGQQLIYLKNLDKDKYINSHAETGSVMALEKIEELTIENLQLTTNIEGLTLKTDENITTLKELQESVDENLKIISNSQISISNKIQNLNGQLADLETRSAQQETKIATIENLTDKLQIQMDELKRTTNQELNLAQIEQNKTDIDYLKLLLGIDRAENPEDVSLLGKLEASEVVAGVFTVKITDEESKTIGTAAIKAVETDEDEDGKDDNTGSDGKSVTVKTKAVGEDSKIFVTSERPVEIGANSIETSESFRIELSQPVEKDLKVNWWIIEEK